MNGPDLPEPIDLTRIRTVPLENRASLVEIDAFAEPTLPGPDLKQLIDSIPRIHAGQAFRDLVEAVALAKEAGATVVLGMGAHVIKVGLSPLVNDLLERGVISAVAMNGAGIIHDLEIALVGRSSEDVGQGLEDGSFGMARETAEELNRAAREAQDQGIGLGQAVGERILALDAPFERYSILARCARLKRPATVHVAIGTDIIHMHGSADGAAIGASSLTDFRLLAAVVSRMSQGVYLNVGSAVVLPEVFLKALNLARNVGHEVRDFTTANLDQIRHYRPRVNVLNRPGGRAIELVGQHELLFPLFRLALLGRLGVTSKTGENR